MSTFLHPPPIPVSCRPSRPLASEFILNTAPSNGSTVRTVLYFHIGYVQNSSMLPIAVHCCPPPTGLNAFVYTGLNVPKLLKWMDWMGWKSLLAPLLRASVCGANNIKQSQTNVMKVSLTKTFISKISSHFHSARCVVIEYQARWWPSNAQFILTERCGSAGGGRAVVKSYAFGKNCEHWSDS